MHKPLNLFRAPGILIRTSVDRALEGQGRRVRSPTGTKPGDRELRRVKNPARRRMNTHDQRLTVVMAVLNARPYLNESIGSILSQTYADFDFVIRDDGSTDGSTEMLRGWA